MRSGDWPAFFHRRWEHSGGRHLRTRRRRRHRCRRWSARQINGRFSRECRQLLLHKRQPFCPDRPHILWEHGRFYPIHKSGGICAIPLDHGGQEHPCQKPDIKCGLPIRLIVVRLGGQSRQPIQHRGHLPDGVAEQMLQLLLGGNLCQKALSGFVVKDSLLGLAMKKPLCCWGSIQSNRP